MKEDNKLFFSVIIPVYKVEKYINECVDSVLKQSFQDVEIILVDDGSPDNCPKICDRYAEMYKNIKVVHQKNSGLSEARNSGLRIAKGRYICFLDSDDYYIDSNFLKSVWKQINDFDTELIFHRRCYYHEKNKKLENASKPYSSSVVNTNKIEDLFLELSKKDQLDASAALKIIKRDFLISNSLYFKKGILSEDVEWFFRMALCLKNAKVINDVAYCYRLREGSITHTTSEKHVIDMIDIVSSSIERVNELIDNGKMKLSLLNYLSYQYYITLGLIYNHLIHKKEKGENFFHMYKWLTKYSISSKTKLASIIVKYGGGLAPFILGKYIAWK